jgi:hypothetical protein
MTGSTDAVSAWVRRRSRARPGSLAVPALSRCRDARERRPHARTPVGPGRDAVLLDCRPEVRTGSEWRLPGGAPPVAK